MEAIDFDICQTLAYYPFPPSWVDSYRPAFEHIVATLSKYNSRINPREIDVPSDVIFEEIIEGTRIPKELMDEVFDL